MQTSGALLPSGVGATALIVAQKRAEESLRPDRLFDDPFAKEFLAEEGATLALGGMTAMMAGLPEPSRETVNAWRRDWIASRTRYFDDYLSGAVAESCGQVVILAAGLDTRAFRLNWPEGTEVFELDLPEVLAFKERVLARVAAAPACRRHILPIDLREDWPSALLATGFDPGAPTAWLIEGLLMYLDEQERDKLLGQVGNLSGQGSQLAVEHRPPAAGLPVAPSASENASSSSDDLQEHMQRISASAGSDASLTGPAAWLAGHGWKAQVVEPAEQIAAYGRIAPEPTNPLASALLQGWLAAAVRN